MSRRASVKYIPKIIKVYTTKYVFEELLLLNSSFEKLLLEAIDEGLSSLGDSSKQSVYFHLEKTFNINKQNIPHKIEEFADALEKIFGVGAKVLEIVIMRQLYEKVGGVVEYGQEDLVFTEYVAAMKQSFLKKKQRTGPIHGCVAESEKKE
ncbi:hypothetical protein GWO13_11400 [Candidatus Bathyarchaeota archaeon]|nr:hypothetical protein [Candidatus Bathyarchaeota archaeon]